VEVFDVGQVLGIPGTFRYQSVVKQRVASARQTLVQATCAKPLVQSALLIRQSVYFAHWVISAGSMWAVQAAVELEKQLSDQSATVS